VRLIKRPKENEDAESRFFRMTNEPVKKLIVTLAGPTMVSMMVTAIYNTADTFFVSQLGTSASGAVGVVLSLMAMIQAIGFTLGVGSGNCVSRMLGQKNQKRAEQAAATGFFGALLLGLLLAVFGNLYIDSLVRMLGATDTILPYARDYARYILIGAPYMAGSFVLNNILRGQGSAFYAMLGIGTGGILNILLDPIFIFVFGWGISGAAIATILSQAVSFSILTYLSMGRHGNIKVSPKNIVWDPKLISEILGVGFPSFCRQGVASVATVLLNLSAGPFGDAAIAAMGITGRVMMLVNSLLFGFGQGFQPVAAFNYGAKRYDRVLSGFWFCVKVGVAALSIAMVLVFIGAPSIITAFRRDDPLVIAIGTTALRFQCLLLPLHAWIVMSSMFTQSTAQAARSTVLAISRQGLFFMPLITILPKIIGLKGVFLAQPIADFCSFLLAVVLAGGLVRRLSSQIPDNAGAVQ
jgi:putative MATE family efflux protein